MSVQNSLVNRILRYHWRGAPAAIDLIDHASIACAFRKREYLPHINPIAVQEHASGNLKRNLRIGVAVATNNINAGINRVGLIGVWGATEQKKHLSMGCATNRLYSNHLAKLCAKVRR